MRHIAIIGSGPAGYYTAEAAQKAFGDEVRIDMFDRMPVPYGLIRSGVAPDHQSIKGVSRALRGKVALSDNVRFVGNVTIGADVSVAELQRVLRRGRAGDRRAARPRARYSGRGPRQRVRQRRARRLVQRPSAVRRRSTPTCPGKTAVVIGMGNVALDVARILAKTRRRVRRQRHRRPRARRRSRPRRIERIVLLGRRGPHQIMMTPKELGRARPPRRAPRRTSRRPIMPAPEEDAILEPGLRKSVAHLRAFAATPEHIRAEKPMRDRIRFHVSAQGR